MLEFPRSHSVAEDAVQSLLDFSMTGSAFGDIPFSLSPLTYQQFRETTGLSVTHLFSNAPAAAASLSELLSVSF